MMKIHRNNSTSILKKVTSIALAFFLFHTISLSQSEIRNVKLFVNQQNWEKAKALIKELEIKGENSQALYFYKAKTYHNLALMCEGVDSFIVFIQDGLNALNRISLTSEFANSKAKLENKYMVTTYNRAANAYQHSDFETAYVILSLHYQLWENPAVLKFIGNSAIQTKRYEQAIKIFDIVLSIDSLQAENNYIHQLYLTYNTGQLEKHNTIAAKAYEKHPDSFQILKYFIQSQESKKEVTPPEKIELYKRVLDFDENNQWAINNLAVYNQNMGIQLAKQDAEKALGYYEEALKYWSILGKQDKIDDIQKVMSQMK